MKSENLNSEMTKKTTEKASTPQTQKNNSKKINPNSENMENKPLESLCEKIHSQYVSLIIESKNPAMDTIWNAQTIFCRIEDVIITIPVKGDYVNVEDTMEKEEAKEFFEAYNTFIFKVKRRVLKGWDDGTQHIWNVYLKPVKK